MRAAWQTLQNSHNQGRLLFNARLVNEHDGDIVPDRVNPFALNAPQTARIRFQLDGSLAERANENVQQILAYRHMAFRLLIVTGGTCSSSLP